eukprot:COSAG02_NODE_229_length_28128_cov_18.529131_7_plen_67_part_00
MAAQEVLSGELTLRELWLDGELLASNVTVGVTSSSAAASQCCSSRPESLAGSVYWTVRLDSLSFYC